MAEPAEDIQDEELEVSAPDPAAAKKAADEAEARRMGWRPYEEYRGPPGQWRTAAEFLERGKTILPIVRKDLEKQREINANMESEIKALRSTVDEQKTVMEDLLKMARTANESGYQRAIEELKAQKRQAAQAGDMATVVAIDDKIDEIQEERLSAKRDPEPKKPVEQPTLPKPPVNPAVDRFIAENPWFKTDAVLNKAMEAEHIYLLQESPDLSLEENLHAAKEAVMDRYPSKFPGHKKPKATAPVEEEEEVVEETPPPRRRQSSVSAPSAPAGGRVKATGIASIEDPQERAVAQQAFNRAKRQMSDLTEAEWFSIYQDPKGDYLEARRATKGKK